MAVNKLSAQEFIQNSFSPVIATFCSPLVELTCKKNNLTFTELLQPFCKLTAEANFRDPSGTLVAIKNLRIVVSDVNSRPPQPTMARKFLNESVSASCSERNTVVQIGELSLDVPVGVPWFEAWRDTFLQVQFPSDHEFTKHYLACMIVVSSQEISPMDNYIQMASQLQQMQSISPAKLPKWFSPSVLRYYVLLHDNMDGNLSAAETTFELMKNTYGINNCFFLNINSQSESSFNNDSHQPDPWSQFISKQLYSQDINEADINMVDGSNHTDGLGGVEPAQEAGETPTTPVILHPLSPVTEPHHLLAVNNIHDKGVVADSLTNCWPSHGARHGAHLSSADLERLRQFINDFCIRCLIPHIETQIQQLTDVISNKKGVSRSLLSATKRWFGSNKPGLPNSPTAAVMYLSDSPELQLRRLGDLCFMFGAYSLAFTAYHGAKRDFNADAAWLHYAGALEMAALSLFMQGSDTSRKAHEYAEESILTYLNSCRKTEFTCEVKLNLDCDVSRLWMVGMQYLPGALLSWLSCEWSWMRPLQCFNKMPQFATRATLFSAECLKARNFHGEAAKQLIRMTSEDSDLRSALLLEQAAYCFLSSVRPQMPRKYAFHLVLAGHRYSKAGQRKHSLRCYRQAYQVYENKSWSLAEDHIHHTIGRQASNLKLTAEATEAFARLLPRASRQAATQQATFLREYLTAQQQLNQETGEMPILPLPIVESDSIQVLLGSCHHRFDHKVQSTLIPASGVTFDLNNTDQFRWWKVEEQLVSFASGSQPMVFKPTVELLTNFTNNTSCPVTYVGEPVLVSVTLNNPLHISIPLHHLHLLWSFIPNSEGLCQDNSSNMNSQIATTQVIDSVLLLPDSASKIVLQVTPKEIGELRITGLAYNLAGDSNGVVAVAGRQLLMARGPKLRPAKDKKPEDGPVYAIDNRLRLNVMESAPCLKVSFEGLKPEMLCGELLQVTIHLENVGTLPVCRVLLGSPTPQLFSVGNHHPGDVAVLPLAQPLAPGQKTQLSMYIRAPDTKGNTTLEFLFYYDSQHLLQKPVYRLIRHSWPLAVYESIQVTATATRSSSNSMSEEKLNLRIQVQNNNQVNDPLMSEICIVRLSLYSIHWQLSSQAFFPPDLKLEAQELVHLMVQALRKDRSQPHLSCVVLDQDGQLSPFQDFLAPTLPETLDIYSEPTTLSDSESLELQAAITIQATLIIMWKGYVTEGSKGKRTAVGQHHVLLKKIGEMSSWPPLPCSNATTPITPLASLKIFGDESSKESLLSSNLILKQRLLTFTLHYKLTVHHDFSLQRLCIVPVEVVLQNCSDSDLTAKLETCGTTTNTSSNKGQLFSPHSCHWFYWVGFSRRVMSLGPHCSRSIQLSAAVAAPGAYDLGSHLVVQAKHSNDLEFVPQSWRSDAVLIVT